ncbi:MAG: peptidoglycan-associated lipoprotein Pal [Lysobacterales bacterium]|jgi:peptidoglycan-associated lipoprotein|nr:MAG: peptidoglycan-associated lipoprotein Pal [Xanthomonadales bacterium]
MKLFPYLAVAVLALGLAACQKPKQTRPDAEVMTPGATDSGAAASGLGSEGAGVSGGAPLTPQQQALAALMAQQKNVIFFDFDSSEIRSEFVPVVAAHAAYLVKFPGAQVRVEGHTDERGSREYNIGLGERRAQTVRRALMAQGVADTQITTVSYGEERPAVEGSDEAAFAQNRRVELVHAQ